RLTIGIGSGLPCRGTRLPGRVTEFRGRLFPRHGSSAFDKCLGPVLAPAVPASIDEALELAVRHLESIDPEVVERTDETEPNGVAAAKHVHHARRYRVHRIDPEVL